MSDFEKSIKIKGNYLQKYTYICVVKITCTKIYIYIYTYI